MDDDFFKETTEFQAEAGTLAQSLHSLLDEHVRSVSKIAELETEAAALKERVREIEDHLAPAVLREMGTELWVDPESKLQIELVRKMDYLPVLKDKDEEARQRREIFRNLEPLGIGEILRLELELNFPPAAPQAKVLRHLFGLDAEVDEEHLPEVPAFSNYDEAMIQDFIAHFNLHNLPASEKQGAHPMTFKKWMREQIEAGNGKKILDAGLYYYSSAKVSLPKPKRGGKK